MARATRKRAASPNIAQIETPTRASKRTRTKRPSETIAGSSSESVAASASSSSAPTSKEQSGNTDQSGTTIEDTSRPRLTDEEFVELFPLPYSPMPLDSDVSSTVNDEVTRDTPSSVSEQSTMATSTISSIQMKRKARPKVSLTKLPRELRDQIYAELLVHYNGIVPIRQAKFHLAVKSTPTFPLAIARCCKQIKEEALKVFYSQNNFSLDLNILSAIDWLGSLPTLCKTHMTSISLAKTIMTGYVRYEIGLFDSSRLRCDLVKKLMYDLDLTTINIEVPDEIPSQATAGPNAGLQNLLVYHPRNEYSWSLTREFVDVLLAGGASEIRLCYPSLHHSATPESVMNLSAVQRLLFLDDEYEVDVSVKRTEMARAAGKRPEFAGKADVEKYVRSLRSMRDFEFKYVDKKVFETGAVVQITRPAEKSASGEDGGRKKSCGGLARRRVARDYFQAF